MIQANELRIGNWVSIGEMSYRPLNKVIPELCSSYEPIELTPEILIDCGFEKGLDHFWYSPNIEIGVLFHDSGLTVTTQSVSRPVTHLHQLQNLYFALTGEELTVNL